MKRCFTFAAMMLYTAGLKFYKKKNSTISFFPYFELRYDRGKEKMTALSEFDTTGIETILTTNVIENLFKTIIEKEDTKRGDFLDMHT